MPDQFLNIRFRIKSAKQKDNVVTPGYYEFDRVADLSKASQEDIAELVVIFLKAIKEA